MKASKISLILSAAYLIIGSSHAVADRPRSAFLSERELSAAWYVNVNRVKEGRFHYFYRIKNDKHSLQQVHNIFIFFDRAPHGGNKSIVSPEGWPDVGTFSGELADWMPAVFRTADARQAEMYEKYPEEVNDTDPEEMPFEELERINKEWREVVNLPPDDSIDPGELSDEFGIMNHDNPPGIVESVIFGWAPTSHLFGNVIWVPVYDHRQRRIVEWREELADDWSDSIFGHPRSVPNMDMATNSVRGRTIGPATPTPPSNLNGLTDTYILRLIDEVREAAALGWIKLDSRDTKFDWDDADLSDTDRAAPGAAKAAITLFVKARRECLRGRFGTAREALRALTRLADAQRGKHFTDEAYYLIKFNAEFLREKL